MTISFRYRAASLDGQVRDGTVRADSQRAALDELRRQSLYAIRVEEVAAAGARHVWQREGLGTARALWARATAAMLSAGLPMDRALAFVSAQSANPAFAGAAREVRDAVRGGDSLSGALRARAGAFGTLLPAAAEAGEASGTLHVSLERAAEQLEAFEALRGELRAALLYPAVMAIAIGAGVAVLLLAVVPRFAAMLADLGAPLPLSTRLLVGASGVLTTFWWAWMGLAVLGMWSASQALAREHTRARFDAARLRWPVVGPLERAWVSAHFARTLALMLRSGAPLLTALAVARSGIGNRAISARLAEAEDAVRRGERLSTAVSDILPPLAAQLLAAGEESGRLDEMSLHAARILDDEVRRTLRSAVSLVEPGMILLLGAVVGFIALAMVQAIYSVNAAL